MGSSIYLFYAEVTKSYGSPGMQCARNLGSGCAAIIWFEVDTRAYVAEGRFLMIRDGRLKSPSVFGRLPQSACRLNYDMSSSVCKSDESAEFLSRS